MAPMTAVEVEVMEAAEATEAVEAAPMFTMKLSPPFVLFSEMAAVSVFTPRFFFLPPFLKLNIFTAAADPAAAAELGVAAEMAAAEMAAVSVFLKPNILFNLSFSSFSSFSVPLSVLNSFSECLSA